MRRRAWLVVAAALVALVAGTAVSLAWSGSGHLPGGTQIAGVDVGGRDPVEAARLVDGVARSRQTRGVLLRANGRVVLRTTASALGARADLDGAIAEAQRGHGRLDRLAARVGLRDGRDIPLRHRADPRLVATVVRRAAARLDRPAESAVLRIREGEPEVVPAVAGQAVRRLALRRALLAVPADVDVPLQAVEPAIDDEAARRAEGLARDVLTAPPAVVVGGRRVPLDRAVLLRALRVTPQAASIAVTLDPAVLASSVRPRLEGIERPARNATFAVAGRTVTVRPSQEGRALDAPRLARAVVARPRAAQVRAPLRRVAPARTTAAARAMRIREVVGEFTTRFPCCAPRVTNIRLAARILDGAVIPPGGRFSLNEALGERTSARGFLAAPQIRNGRLEDSVGGGVSQVATTTYNAAFFAGLHLVQHTPHQFYISRYPMGREATVSWGGPELIFENDWPAGVLLQAETTETSITVRLFSSRLGRRVETTTGQPYDRRPARTITTVDPALPRGARRVAQDGGVEGFSIDYTRRVYRGRELKRNERFHVEYDPEDTYIEVGPA